MASGSGFVIFSYVFGQIFNGLFTLQGDALRDRINLLCIVFVAIGAASFLFQYISTVCWYFFRNSDQIKAHITTTTAKFTGSFVVFVCVCVCSCLYLCDLSMILFLFAKTCCSQDCNWRSNCKKITTRSLQSATQARSKFSWLITFRQHFLCV